MPDILGALQEGRVHHLLVARNYHVEGRQCGSCRAVVIDNLGACPYCGQALGPAADAVDLAVHRAIECGAKVSLMDNVGPLEQAGGIAAALRY